MSPKRARWSAAQEWLFTFSRDGDRKVTDLETNDLEIADLEINDLKINDRQGQEDRLNNVDEILDLVQRELLRITDAKLICRIRELLVTPYQVKRAWDYGTPEEHFICWTVFEHRPSNTGIAFCSRGFGPSYPWGLVHLSGPHMSIGMDAGWFVSLEDGMRNSAAWDGPNPEGYEVQ